jgi:hypothetical protein
MCKLHERESSGQQQVKARSSLANYAKYFISNNPSILYANSRPTPGFPVKASQRINSTSRLPENLFQTFVSSVALVLKFLRFIKPNQG